VVAIFEQSLGENSTKFNRFSLEYSGVKFVAHSILLYTSIVKNDSIRALSLKQYYDHYLLESIPHSILSILYKQKSRGGVSANMEADGIVTAPCGYSLPVNHNVSSENLIPSSISSNTQYNPQQYTSRSTRDFNF
jgi:hypothetical protein